MMQHQYWVTKKTVLKKLGTKEDECIVASDAELDAKLELFQSISDSCLQLQRVLDQYQERLCILAQEENSLGKFLRDAGKDNDASGKHMISAGKAIAYSGQQRLSIRSPLLRLYHEVETFRCRAVKDMRATVSAMEKARIEYRAALSWMKSTSTQLDPDTGRGLDNFRKAQHQIDLLAAARCNMFSHVLSTYQNSFLNFSQKVSQTLSTTIESMNAAPQYEFCVLKSLAENDINKEENDEEPKDKDQMLFFQDEYKDEREGEKTSEDNLTNELAPVEPSTSSILIDTEHEENMIGDLAGLQLGGGDMPANFSFMPSQLLQDFSGNLKESPLQPINTNPINEGQNMTSHKLYKPMELPKKDDKAAWFKLFAELDPLANPDQLTGSNSNQSHAA
ncbi:unnamed protein product [Leptidea sinapis]|uniref:AH domain-containing protein n=1 Tax=Leptidea sinapis TaxID=189913 RepID=A0A5E4QSD4_9NEOP|nr:unnamed protein product [Leptidea sinapis]